MDSAPGLPGGITRSHEEVEVLLTYLHAPQKEVRAEAARLLGQAGARALPGLLKARQDPDWVVRYRALEALTAVVDPCIDSVLIAALGDERDHVRYIAAKGLGMRKVRSARVSLCRTLGDENEFVRMCAARSLAALGDSAAIPALRARLQNENVVRVIVELKKALARLE
jgi:HEAT repeat protein